MTDRLIPPWEDEAKPDKNAIALGIEHAFLAPSSAVKWLVCGPSAQLEATMPEDEDGMAGEWGPEGTLAHTCAERAARNWFWREQFERDPAFTKEMFAAAEQWRKVLDAILGDDRNDWTFRFEDRINIESFTAPGQFGRTDFWGYNKKLKRLVVADFKFGIGVRVLAELNDQMMIYGGGLLRTFKNVWEVDEVELVIHQPRISPVPSRWVIKAKHLETWLKEVCHPAAKKALSKDPGDFVPGEHCSKGFCKARFKCRARAEHMMAVFKKHGTLDPKKATTSLDETGRALPEIALAKKWANDIERFAKVQAIDRKLPVAGHKVVRGPGKRVFKNIPAVVAMMADYGYAESEFLVQSINVTAMDKLLEPDHEVWSLCETEDGGPILVPNSDPRPAFERVSIDAFDDEADEAEPEAQTQYRPEDF